MRNLNYKQKVPIRKHIRKGKSVRAHNRIVRKNRNARGVCRDCREFKEIDLNLQLCPSCVKKTERKLFRVKRNYNAVSVRMIDDRRALREIKLKTPTFRVNGAKIEEETIVPIRMTGKKGQVSAGFRTEGKPRPVKIGKELGESPKKRYRFVRGRLPRDFATVVEEE